MTEQEKKTAKDTAMIGNAAEHYVMCQLLRRNLIAALALKGVPEVDILVSDRRSNSLAEIQVKGRRFSKDGSWTMNAKHERDDFVRPRLFYCFVDFGKSDDEEPKCWVIPSKVVADILKRSHQAWLDTPGKGGRPHVDWPMRRITASYTFDPALGPDWMHKYRNAWEQISTGVS